MALSVGQLNSIDFKQLKQSITASSAQDISIQKILEVKQVHCSPLNFLF